MSRSWSLATLGAFLLFFAMALAEAFIQQDLLLTAVFLGLGIVVVVVMTLRPYRVSAGTQPGKTYDEPLIPTPLY